MMAGQTTRPKIPRWPGYGCGKSLEQWEAPHRGRQGAFDTKLRKALRIAETELAAAITAGDRERAKHAGRLVQMLRDGVLPGRSATRMKTTTTGAPICRPGGLTTPLTMANRQPNDEWVR